MNDNKSEAGPRFGERGAALRTVMAEIARLAVMRLPPFSSLGPESCLTPFERVLQRRPPAVQQRAREAFVGHMEFIVSDHVCIDQLSLQTWSEIDAEYQGDFAANYVPLVSPPLQISVRESKQIIRETCAGLDGFTYEKARGGILTFSRPAPGVDSVLFELDLGSQGPGGFKAYLGTRAPDYSVELGTLLCLPRRTWRYSSADECRKSVVEVCSLVSMLMPVLDQKLQQLDGLI